MVNLLEQCQGLDLADKTNHVRNHFLLPDDKVYLCSNSLGLPTKASLLGIDGQMKKWANEGAHGWFKGDDAWYESLHRDICHGLSKVLGARDNEVVAMNSLTVNLHLLLTSFYRPTASRFKILIGDPVFPSDLYAIKSHLKLHNLDPETALIRLKPRQQEFTLRPEDIEAAIKHHGGKIALVYLSAANYLTGQVLNIRHLTSLAHEAGCLVGVDIAHAAGNIALQLHEDEVDFAVGCSYKYLCGGPGGPGIAFVHANHHETDLFRLSGWWGNDPATRFQMDKCESFVPFGGAASWQVSTPSIISLQPLISSLKLFSELGMTRLREKSVLQTSFLLSLLSNTDKSFEIVTPLNADERGNQISLKLSDPVSHFSQQLEENGFMCDFRPPNILRIAPSPLYNSFKDIHDFIIHGFDDSRGGKNDL